jgi:hypothetical protein
MSMDDPGWDTPGFDDGPAPDGWNEPTAAAPGGSGSGGSGGTGGVGGSGGPPVWQNPKYLGIGGGAVAIIIIIVLIVLVAGGGGGSPKTTPTPAAVVTSLSPSVTPTPTPSPSITPTPTPTKAPKVETVDQYDKKADHLCAVYKPKLSHAENVSIGDFVKVANAEFKKIRAVKKPTEGAEDIKRWLTDAGAALKDAKARNVNAYNASILHADTFAGELGMHVCNYGH